MAAKLKSLKNQEGFTILEIVAVLVVIGILLALVIAGYSGVQRNRRNQTRRNDIDYVYQQLETYNVENSKYPSLAEINDPGWRASHMKNLNPDWLQDPSGKSPLLVSKAGKGAYAYDPTSAGGGACDDVKTACLHYTLTATLENSTPNTYVKTSLN